MRPDKINDLLQIGLASCMYSHFDQKCNLQLLCEPALIKNGHKVTTSTVSYLKTFLAQIPNFRYNKRNYIHILKPLVTLSSTLIYFIVKWITIVIINKGRGNWTQLEAAAVINNSCQQRCCSVLLIRLREQN